ncbi:MEKHLA domain-containing protein [Cohnella cholangitidis]|uniref:MEKHLA domain-containing protein n=2 Tax=Cohnella cholangitidis TaxID=2598458 RepID=A0A7G5C6U2_9BACL|nr:MEKHLA domain-containing protein [Cohnella cholangitidis]
MTGRNLLEYDPQTVTASEALNRAPFVLLSHGTEPDPVLNYGNNAALALWEMSWEEFTSTPSRLTAEAALQSQREQLLEDTQRQGYSDGYYGIRISKSGIRFEIQNVLLWNIVDDAGEFRGQAAVFTKWERK